MFIELNGSFTQKFGLLLFAFSFLFHETNANLTNVAYLIIEDGDDVVAVDGDKDSCLDLDESVWKLYLKDYFIVQHIRVYDYMNECNNVVAKVSMDDVTYKMFDSTPREVNSTYHIFEPLSPMGAWIVKLSMTLTGSMSFCEVEVMVQERESFYLKSQPGVMNDGWGTEGKIRLVLSIHQCAYLCMRNKMCNGINVKQGVNSTVEMECQLHVLGPEYFDLVQDPDTAYWEMI